MYNLPQKRAVALQMPDPFIRNQNLVISVPTNVLPPNGALKTKVNMIFFQSFLGCQCFIIVSPVSGYPLWPRDLAWYHEAPGAADAYMSGDGVIFGSDIDLSSLWRQDPAARNDDISITNY